MLVYLFKPKLFVFAAQDAELISAAAAICEVFQRLQRFLLLMVGQDVNVPDGACEKAEKGGQRAPLRKVPRRRLPRGSEPMTQILEPNSTKAAIPRSKCGQMRGAGFLQETKC